MSGAAGDDRGPDMPNSDAIDRDVSARRQLEGHVQDTEDRGLMLTDDDEDAHGSDAAQGLDRSYRATAGSPDIGDSDEPGSDRG